MIKSTYILCFVFVAGIFLSTGCKSRSGGESGSVARTDKGGGKGELDPKTREQVSYMFVEANTQYIQGKNEEALALFEQVLEKDPKNHASLYNIAKIKLEIGQFDDAVDFSRRAIALDGENYWYYDIKSKAHQGKLEYEKALVVMETMVKKFPEDKDVRFDIAQMYIQTKKYEKALAAYDDLEKIIGLNQELVIRKHQLNLQLNQPEEAIKELDKLIDDNPYDPRFYQMKFDILMAMEEEERARETMQTMLKFNPDDGFAMLSMADYYRSIGEDKKSDEYLFRAFNNPQVDLEAKIQILAGMYAYAKSDPEMLNRIQELSAILYEKHEESALLNGIQGDLYQLAGEPDSAKYYYRRAIKLDAVNEQVWQELLILHTQENDFKAMQKDAEAALEYFPNQTAFLYFFGLASQRLEDNDEAIYAFEKIKKTGGNNADLLLQACLSLAEIYHDEEQFRKSDENFDLALEIEGNNAMALNNYAYYLSLRNERLAEAEEMVLKAIKFSPNNSAYEDTYGWILYLQGDYSGAEQWIMQSINHGGDGEVYEHFGDVMMKQGNQEKAEEYWKKAKETGVPDLKLEDKLRQHNIK